MISTGSAAAGTSVMVQFPLAGPIDELVHGTAYHWDRKEPERAGPLTFEATHDFLVPRFHGAARAAIFHAAVPAWAVGRDGSVVGALWRNANREQCDFLGAEGSDGHEVALSYAIRIPSGVTGPRTGKMLREALAFETPLLAATGRPAGRLPRAMSLASATPRSAILTAAKVGTAADDALVLRIYQPTNGRLRVVVRTSAARRFPSGRRLVVEETTALEDPLAHRRVVTRADDASARRFHVVARRALTTLAIRARRSP